ncbi:GspH/FimT family pseudopilin [Halomonas urumqiensis]|uniref:Type II secretion system protein H n=1 Tax=Halomonas urumqiensis TaxID=1684789 RepID=A0A2N7UPA1_9GAMM|nr:GspH/FimT family pseudopilin [Halomonas urumqiensis]PMR82259.1 type II secretion system protein GspH [Halomonas urumqiensis]PTB02963.1 type II secretion system protein GspH [Halomonas urumqiensis]GHE20920.1 type II secretion system protein GspH [Halomonas urumqiensis]
MTRHGASGPAPQACGVERRAGFTLVELMVVLAIVAMTVAVVPPLVVKVMPAMQAQAAARELASGLREARSTAMADNREVVVEIDLERRTYHWQGQRIRAELPSHVALDVLTGDAVGTRGQFHFYPDGSASGGRASLAWRGREWVVDIDWLTGRVTLDEY